MEIKEVNRYGSGFRTKEMSNHLVCVNESKGKSLVQRRLVERRWLQKWEKYGPTYDY